MTPSSSPKKPGLFANPAGGTYLVVFLLVSSLFLLWGFCNGMIDVMDKHFQDQLQLSKSQSAWVQFAHYMGYALMALPAGLLTRRLGYKGGIVFGLLLVSVGGFWFLPATGIAQFWAFLLGVCLIAMGLTVLETVANPYTTVLGPREYGAARINLAQACNGIGWILGPVVGSLYFYSEGGAEKAGGRLYMPYVGVAIVVLVLAALFLRSRVPEIQVEDDYHTDDATPVAKPRHPALIGLMLTLNLAAAALSAYLVLHTILPACGVSEHAVESRWWLFLVPVILAAPAAFSAARKLTAHSIWAHPHFSGATLAQFLYVAAQAGIFSFFINSMTVDKGSGYCMVPALPASLEGGLLQRHHWIEHRVFVAPSDIRDVTALVRLVREKSGPVAAFLHGHLSTGTLRLIADGADASSLRAALASDLNARILRAPDLHDPAHFAGVRHSPATRELLAAPPASDNDRLRLGRMLLADALPGSLPYDDTRLSISDKGASLLSSFAFGLFLLGRLVGAALMRRARAHTTLGAFALASIAACALVIGRLGWLSVAAVLLSYLFMSIMYPTIFALGIFGIGSQSKKKAAAFIVMAITGGALMPKFMGRLGDLYDMSASFWMPLGCFAFIAAYAFCWPRLSGDRGDASANPAGGQARRESPDR